MSEVELELAILLKYVEHHDSVGLNAPKCERELDMRDVILDVTGEPPNDATVKRLHSSLAPPTPYPPGVLRPCSDSTINKGPHKYHTRAFFEPGKRPAWERIGELESQLQEYLVLHRPMIPFDLALCHRMIGPATRMRHALCFKPVT